MSDHVDHGCNNNHDHDNHDDCDVHGDHGDYLTMMKLVTMMTMTTKTTLSTKISISCVPIYIVIRLEHCWMSTDFYRKCLRIVVWDWNNGKHWDVNFCESLLQLSGKVGHYYGNACSTLWGGELYHQHKRHRKYRLIWEMEIEQIVLYLYFQKQL